MIIKAMEIVQTFTKGTADIDVMSIISDLNLRTAKIYIYSRPPVLVEVYLS